MNLFGGLFCFSPVVSSRVRPKVMALPLRNVEVKAALGDRRAQVEAAAAAIADSGPHPLQQADVFFPLPSGSGNRLKLRREQTKNQLIWYSRPDAAEAKESEYRLVQLTSEQANEMEDLLASALGRLPTVSKLRQLYLVGQTRIHIDHVQDLGDYMELEVVMRPEETLEDGQKIVDDILSKLGIKPEDLLSGAYLDMLMKKQKNKN